MLGDRRRARALATGPEQDDPWRRMRLGLALLAVVLVAGSVGYVLLGLSPLDAFYQTATTVSTVGFRELGHTTTAWKLFTVALILLGAGTVLYILSVLLETLVEGRLTDHLWRRRMQRRIDGMSGHVVVCGWGRLGRSVTDDLLRAGRDLVVIERDPAVEECPAPFVLGDATDDAVLARAGLERAGVLIAVLDTDADNLYVTLSARSTRPELLILARARLESAERKLRQAGADRVVNPHLIGGSRIAAMTLQPHVSEFLDVVMHEGGLEFRLAEVDVAAASELVGRTLRQAGIRGRTGAMVLAIRRGDGSFATNPPADTRLSAHEVLIAIGTAGQLEALSALAEGSSSPGGGATVDAGHGS